MAITLNAFEAVAVVTAMPAISADLHGDRLYGAAFSAYMLANLVSLVVSGEQSDRRGPAVPFLIGVGSFGAGLAIAGAAPTFAVVILGRVLQGAGAGALANVAYVAIGRGWSTEEQPRLFALLSTAWVVPSLLAPLAAGWISEQFGWRWVFLSLLPLIPVLLLLALAPLVALGPPEIVPARPSQLPVAARLAVGSGLAVAGLQASAPLAVLALVAVGIAIAGPALVRVLPPGTLRAAPGIPAAVAARLCVNIAFFGTDTFVPFAAVRLHGASTLVGGAVIIGGSLLWTTGAQVSARAMRDGSPGLAVRTGFIVLAVGILGTSLVAIRSTPLALTFFTWAIGGFGIGLVFNTTSSTAIAQAPSGQEGLVGGQLGVADSFGFAAISAVGGAIIGVADRTALQLGPALGIVFALAASVAMVGALIAPRVRLVTPQARGGPARL
jgi:MFS family permease